MRRELRRGFQIAKQVGQSCGQIMRAVAEAGNEWLYLAVRRRDLEPLKRLRRRIRDAVSECVAQSTTAAAKGWRSTGGGYRPSLRRKLTPLYIGFGKVEAISSQRFREIFDEAIRTTNPETPDDALRAVVQRLARDGVVMVEDSLGRRYNADEWAERAVSNAVAEATRDGLLAHLKSTGAEAVKIVTEPDACAKCKPWRGRVVTMTPRVGAWHLDHARRLGLFHPNCRCGFMDSRLVAA